MYVIIISYSIMYYKKLAGLKIVICAICMCVYLLCKGNTHWVSLHFSIELTTKRLNNLWTEKLIQKWCVAVASTVFFCLFKLLVRSLEMIELCSLPIEDVVSLQVLS